MDNNRHKYDNINQLDRIDKIYIYYALLTLIALTLSEISVIPENVIGYINLPLIFLGTILGVYHYVIKKDFWKYKESILFFIFIGISLISVLLNLEDADLSYFKKIYLTALGLFVFYIGLRDLYKKIGKKAYKIILPVILLNMIGFSITLILWFMRINGLLFINERTRIIGIRYVLKGNSISYALLYGIYRDSNYLAIISIIVIFLSLILISVYKSEKKIVLINILKINIIISYLIFILANSRSATIALTLSIFIFGLLYICFIENKHIIKKNKIISILLLLIMSTFMYLAPNLIRKPFTKLMEGTENKPYVFYIEENKLEREIFNNKRDNIKIREWEIINEIDTDKVKTAGLQVNENLYSSEYQNISTKKIIKLRSLPSDLSEIIYEIPKNSKIEILERVNNKWIKIKFNNNEGYAKYKNLNHSNTMILNSDIPSKKTDTENVGSGRLIIWKEAISLFNNKPIFGYGTYKVREEATNILGDKSFISRGNVIDNSYLDILVGYGLISFLVFIATFGYIGIKSFKSLREEYNFDKFIFTACTFFILIIAFFLEEMLSGMSLIFYFFLISLGFMVE